MSMAASWQPVSYWWDLASRSVTVIIVGPRACSTLEGTQPLNYKHVLPSVGDGGVRRWEGVMRKVSFGKVDVPTSQIPHHRSLTQRHRSPRFLCSCYFKDSVSQLSDPLISPTGCAADQLLIWYGRHKQTYVASQPTKLLTMSEYSPPCICHMQCMAAIGILLQQCQ
jgi:hypothetical protein